MRNIQKNGEPATLTEHKKNLGAGFDNYSDKEALRASLAAEQRDLCCYCQARLRPNRDRMKIEHWQCQAAYPGRQLDYQNLLGACLGGQGGRRKDQHCDTFKGNLDLSINPADPACNVERLVKFPGSGAIKSDDPDIDRELNDVLNLNHPQLVANRKAVLDSFCDAIGRQKVNSGWFSRKFTEWRGDDGGNLNPFAQVVVYYLARRLKIVL